MGKHFNKRRLLSFLATLTVLISVFSFANISVSSAATFGDFNNDNSADLKDTLLLRKYMSHVSGITVSDLNGDGLIDMKDVLFHRLYIAKVIDKNGKTITTTKAPSYKNEMRAVWVAYFEVAALMKSTESATKTAIDKVMAEIQSYGANTVIWHVRAYSDAYYKSSYFPLNASVKNLINAGFDPFAYAVTSAHSHGLKIQAWINPYRIGKTLDNARCNDTFKFDGKYYYSPASANVRKLIVNGAKELTKNYKIDGFHLDDYFYPTGISTSAQSFDIGYTASAGSLANWRRNQVSTLIKNIHTACHSINDKISMGVSPGGRIERDRDQGYADVEKWLSTAGYVDYLCPQVYFGMEHSTAPFEKLVKQWCAISRASGVKLYIGIAVYKAGMLNDQYAGSAKTEWAEHSDILVRQVRFLRSRSDIQGYMLFSNRFMNQSAFDSATYNVTISKKEVTNLIKEMKK